MEKQKPILTPEQDALNHIADGRDKPFLEQRFINSFKGKGVFTLKTIKRSMFVVEYRGQISRRDSRSERTCPDVLNGFLFEFSWKGEQWCVDASKEDQTLGRLVNNDHVRPNCVVKKIEFEGKPHLCLFATENISPGEEITCSFGAWTYPWSSERQEVNEASNSHPFSSTPRSRRSIATPVSYHEVSCSDNDSDGSASSDFELSSEFKEMMTTKGWCPSDGDDKSTEDKSEEQNQTFTTKNYCFVCGKGRAKLSRHFQKHAAVEPEIAQALALPKGSSERKAALNLLRSKGNHKHNQNVLRTKCGSLKLLKRPKTNAVKTKKYVHCPYCKGMLTDSDTNSHVFMCVKRKLTVAAVCRTGTLGDVPPDNWEMEQKVPCGVRRILSSMKQDEVTLVLQNDDALVQFALSLMKEHGNDPGKQDYIRRRLREMGRLLFNLHKKCILKLEDAFQPKNFGKVMNVVKIMADFNVRFQTYNKPDLALNVAESLKKIGHVFLNQTKSKMKTKEDVSTFMELCEKEWFEHPPLMPISQTSSSLSTIPFIRDVQRLHRYLENLSTSAVESLTAHESSQAFISLCKLTLTQAMVLNQFSPKVSKLTLRSFQETEDSTQVLFKSFVTVLNETGRSVRILLTSRLVSAVTLLVSKRALCGVHEDNPFLFAKPNGHATGHYSGRRCIRAFSRLCPASKPEHLTSVHFHKHSARIFQILSLEKDELEYLSKLLGHEIQTDRYYYQTPEAVSDLAKIAKLLLAMEKSSLERVEGKSLEDVEIENVLEPDKRQKNPGRAGTKEGTNESPFLLQKLEDLKLKLRAEEDALEHIKSGRDKSFLQEKFIDSFKGKGAFTCESIEPSSFVVEYRGSIFAQEEGEREDTLKNYLFSFSWSGTNWCVDASAEDGSLGRLVNDDQKNPTCELRKVVHEGKPHLCIFALKKISAGEEITFNYGNASYPWRSREETNTKANPPEIDSEDASSVPLDKMEEDFAESSSSDDSSIDEFVCDEESNCNEGFSGSEGSSESEGLPSLDDSDSDTKHLRRTTKNFCFVCGKPQGKISRHLKTHVTEVPEIAVVFKLRRNSKDRKRELAKLRNRGNRMHNKHVLKTRRGELKMRKKLNKSSLETFAVCIYCKDMFRRPTLWQHMQNCPSKVSNPPARGKTRILAAVAATLIDPECMSSDMKKFLESLKEDEVGREILKDPYLLQLAQCIFHTLRGKCREVNVRRRLRQMGRLLLILQEKSINSLEEALKPQNFPSLLEAVEKVAGSDKERKYCQRTVAEIGNSLRKLADIRYAMSLNDEGDREAAQEIEEFMKLCLKEWPPKTAVQVNISSQSTIPFIQDVQVLFQFTQETLTSAAQTLTNFVMPPVYTALLRAIVAYMSFLNGVEVTHVTLKSFQERREADANENNALSEFEHILAKRTVKINVANLKGKEIILVLTPDLLSATELLVEKRGLCGVHENNPHLFAKPSASSLGACSIGSIITMFVSHCGAKKKESLRSSFFSKYVRTVFQILVLGNEELSQLSKLLGRDIPTQKEYYRTPEASADIARILELLSAVSSGSLQGFEGKSLKEINIPDELLPVAERNSATKTEKSEDAALKRAAKKRKSSSSKKPDEQKRKKSQNDDVQTDTQNTTSGDKLEKTAAERFTSSPEQTAAHSRDAAICFSEDEESMHVDFNTNIETDGSDDEANGPDEADDDSDGSSACPAIHGENVVKEASEGQCGKQKDASSGDDATGENTSTNDVKKKDSESKEAEKYDALSSSLSKGKKFPLIMKEVKILLPKLNLEELKALLHPPMPSRDPQLVEDQPHDDIRKQNGSTEETPSFAQTLQMTCSKCKKSMMRGHTAYQRRGFKDVFCSKLCLFQMFPGNSGARKECHFCLKEISKPLDLVMAVVDLKGTTRDFCSTSCLCYFKTKYRRRGQSLHSKSTTISTQTPPSHCSLCNNTCSTSLEVKVDEIVHNFCNDACLEEFCRVNIGVCLSCGATCCKKPLKLKLSDTIKILCDTKCLEEFKEKTDTYHQCLNCHNYLPMSDMLYHRNNDYTVDLFCNWYCLSSYKSKHIKEEEKSDLMNKAGKQSEQTSKADEGQLSSDMQELSSSLSDEAPLPTVALVDTICCNCSKEVIKGSSKYQIHTEVFCCVSCVKEKHPHIKFVFKMCHNCFNIIKRPQNIILAPLDDSGALVVLCSNECLTAVKTKRKMAAVKPQPQQGPCSICKMCAKYRYCKLQVTIDNEVHRFCSQSCLTNYHQINKLPCFVCDVCSNIYVDKRLTVTTEGCRKNICGDQCLLMFKKGALTLLTCPTCRTSHRMSDMIENKDCEAELEFFCSHRCLMVHKAQTITISDVKSSSYNVEEVKPPLPNLNGLMASAVFPKKHGFKIKEEQTEEDYNVGLLTSMFLQNVKDEPDVKMGDLKISSVFSLKEESKAAQPTSEQTDLSLSCSACKTLLRDGEAVYQRKGHGDIFCSTSCLLKFYQNKTVKTCHFCLQTISQPQTALQVLEKNEATTKDFCNQTCLSSFNYKSILATKISIAGPPSHSQCSICCRYCISKHEVIHQEVIHKICSDPCFHRFCNINSLSVCENCQACSKTPLMLKLEEGHKALCSTECLSQFKQKIQTPQLCSMCCTSALMSDMIPHKNREGLLELFCTRNCLMASKIQGLSSSGTELNCNNCGEVRIPACHLAMSDASIRSFCNLTCAMSFKEKHKDNNDAANSQVASSPTEADLYSSPDKPVCAQCRQTIHTPPTVIHYKEGINFVCSPTCSQEFKRINNITSLCEYCKNERLINEVKKVNKKDCCFCSEGCKILFHYELEKEWGKHCHSCTFCSSVSKTVLTAHDEESEKEFCSAECIFGYSSLRSCIGVKPSACASDIAKARIVPPTQIGISCCTQEAWPGWKDAIRAVEDMVQVSACDMCSHTGRLKQSLPLLGEVKHFCDLKCLLRFCNKKVQMVPSGSLASGSVGSGDSLPVITGILSLSNSMAFSTQLGTFTDIQTKVVGHASIQTEPMELKNKSVFCAPLAHNKGISCTVRTVEKQTQTVTLKEKEPPTKPVLPVPVPVYVPLPMSMYSQIAPQPVALPILLPVPIFLSENPHSSEEKLTPAEAIKADFSCGPEKEMNDPTEQEDDGKEEDQRQQTLPPDVASPVMLQTLGDGDGGLFSDDLVSFDDHPVGDPDLQLAFSNTANTVCEPLNPTPPPDPGLGTPCCHLPDLPLQKQSNPPPSPLLNIHDKQERPHNEKTSQQSALKASPRRPQCVKSKYGVLSWRKWIQRRKSQTDVDHVSSSAVSLKADILGCSSSELNESLCLFIKEMKRRNGDPYSPDKLFYLCLCIQKYLFENMRAENIFSDQTYHKFSLELTRILKRFRPTLTGSGVIHSCVEEEFLWDCKQLGVYSPITLLNTLLFFFCKYFHFTTVEQHRQLSFAWLKACIRSKEDGQETSVLRFQPHTSSNQEQPGADVPAKKLRLNESEDFLEIEENSAIPSQCPVRLFKFYVSKCSESTTCRDDAFYLQPGQNCVPSSPLWFSSTPLEDTIIEAMIVRILTIRDIQREESGLSFPNAP